MSLCAMQSVSVSFWRCTVSSLLRGDLGTLNSKSVQGHESHTPLGHAAHVSRLLTLSAIQNNRDSPP